MMSLALPAFQRRPFRRSGCCCSTRPGSWCRKSAEAIASGAPAALSRAGRDEPRQAGIGADASQRKPTRCTAEVPEEALHATAAAARRQPFRIQPRHGDQLTSAPDQGLLTDPRAQSALLGLIEVRRNRAVVLRVLGKPADADALLKSASDLGARQRAGTPDRERAAVARSTALDFGGAGLVDAAALAELGESTAAFGRALPGSKPLAETYLLNARELLRTGHAAEALPLCHGAVLALTALKAGTTPALMAPCLDVYGQAADRQKDQAQQLLAEMFTAAQLAQGGITSQQIAQASATLAENARNPKVGEAIRLQRDLKGKLDTLLSQRDDLTQGQRQGAPPNPEIVGAGRGARQADRRDAGEDGGRRRGVAGGLAELRAARAAGCHGEGRVQRAASGRGVLDDCPGGPGRLGVPAAQQHHHGFQDRGRPARDGRPGEAHPRGHRTDHRRTAAIRHSGRDENLQADAGRRGAAA